MYRHDYTQTRHTTAVANATARFLISLRTSRSYHLRCHFQRIDVFQNTAVFR